MPRNLEHERNTRKWPANLSVIRPVHTCLRGHDTKDKRKMRPRRHDEAQQVDACPLTSTFFPAAPHTQFVSTSFGFHRWTRCLQSTCRMTTTIMITVCPPLTQPYVTYIRLHYSVILHRHTTSSRANLHPLTSPIHSFNSSLKRRCTDSYNNTRRYRAICDDQRHEHPFTRIPDERHRRYPESMQP